MHIQIKQTEQKKQGNSSHPNNEFTVHDYPRG